MDKRKDFDFGEWVSEGLEGMVESRPRMSPPVPEAFKEHTRSAFREMLMAYRSLLDAAIEKTESRPEPPVTKIKID